MNKFQEQIELWLSRTVPERASNQCFDLPMVLASDIGLKRSENQDRVAALRVGGRSSSDQPLLAVAVADGMGGMRDGAKCAALALASFFYALTLHRGHKLERQTELAISYANETVFNFAAGKGGTTLSAIILDGELRPLIVHIGDSRVYAFGNGDKIERLTVDDSLEEAVGGHGRDLLQFVGLGLGLQAHIRSIPVGMRYLAITTDGIHSVAPGGLEGILAYAPDLKAASERLAALSRWCGGHDNASSALIDLQAIMQQMHHRSGDGVQLWDPFGALTAIWIAAAAPASNKGEGQVVVSPDAERRPESARRDAVVSQAGIEARRLLDEQRALAKVRSKHVVQLYDIIELTDRRRPEKAIVLEFIEGQNLGINSFEIGHDYLKILWQVACGLKDIHAARVIHRDIKPDNVRMDTEGVVKIIDFGLARSSADAKTRSIIGTPVFMAPELWGEKTISFDTSIDVYAFGATAIALLTSKCPRELAKQPPEPISLSTLAGHLEGLSPDVVALIHSCLNSDPASRPTMVDAQTILARRLLENQHRALVVMNGQVHQLDRKNRRISLSAESVGSLVIEYDGFQFRVSNAEGNIYLNNSLARAGNVVPGCCVITFGAGNNRRFVTFDVSNPEVMP